MREKRGGRKKKSVRTVFLFFAGCILICEGTMAILWNVFSGKLLGICLSGASN